MKSRDGKRQRRGAKKKEDQKRESLRRKKIQMPEKVGKSRNTVFPMICGSGGSKSRLAKAAGAEQAGQMRDENCTPLWRRAQFQVKMYKTPQLRSTFRSWDVEKVHGVVVPSTFRSQNVTKHLTFGALLEAEMSKKCTPLWRESHFEVKRYKTPHARTTFGRSDVVSRGGRTGLCTLSRVSKTWGFCSISFWQAWDIWRGSTKMHFPWQAQYKRHVHQSC